jgi:DNA-binding MurR/RpiR family transcriptional regulator
VQPSSVVRFAKAFGFRGFSDLQKVFRHRLIEGTPELRNEVYAQHESMEQLAEDAPLHLFKDFSNSSIDAIKEVQQSLTNESLKTALQMMDAAGTIYVLGQRRAFPVASYIS